MWSISCCCACSSQLHSRNITVDTVERCESATHTSRSLLTPLAAHVCDFRDHTRWGGTTREHTYRVTEVDAPFLLYERLDHLETLPQPEPDHLDGLGPLRRSPPKRLRPVQAHPLVSRHISTRGRAPPQLRLRKADSRRRPSWKARAGGRPAAAAAAGSAPTNHEDSGVPDL
jgi:hypothetical protein